MHPAIAVGQLTSGHLPDLDQQLGLGAAGAAYGGAARQ
jgi:hypothetical protein